MIKSIVFCLSAIFITAVPLAGQAQQREKLTLLDCFEQASEYSYRLESTGQQAIAAQQQTEIQKSMALPEISANVIGNSQHLTPYNFQQAFLLVQADWSLGDFIMKTSMADQNMALAAQARQEQVQLQLMQRLTVLYMTMLQKKAQLNLIRERKNLLNDHLVMTRALWEAGSKTELDLLQTRTEITRQEEQVASLMMDYNNARLELTRLMGKTDTVGFGIKQVHLQNLELQQDGAVLDTLLANHPLIRNIDYQVLAQQERRRNIRAGQLPKVNVQSGYVSDADPTGDGNYWQIMAGIRMPLFRWGRTEYQTQQLKADVRTLQLRKEEILRELNIRVNQILEKLRKYRTIYTKQQTRLDFANQAFHLADVNYEAGLTTNLEYLTVQEQYSETKINLQETMLMYAVNLVEYFVVTGQTEQLTLLYEN